MKIDRSPLSLIRHGIRPLWLLTFTAATQAESLTAEWLPPVGGWTTPANWTGGMVPNDMSGNQFTALIGSRVQGVQVVATAPPPYLSLTALGVSNGCKVTSQFTSLSVGSITLDGPGTEYRMLEFSLAPVTGWLTSAISVEIKNGALLAMQGPSLEMKGPLRTETGGALRGRGLVRFSGGWLVNSGVIGLSNLPEQGQVQNPRSLSKAGVQCRGSTLMAPPRMASWMRTGHRTS